MQKYGLLLSAVTRFAAGGWLLAVCFTVAVLNCHISFITDKVNRSVIWVIFLGYANGTVFFFRSVGCGAVFSGFSLRSHLIAHIEYGFLVCRCVAYKRAHFWGMKSVYRYFCCR